MFDCLTDTCHQCRDRLCELHANVSCRARIQQVAARVQLEEDAVRFDHGWNRLLGRRCHSALLARSCP